MPEFKFQRDMPILLSIAVMWYVGVYFWPIYYWVRGIFP